MDYHTKQAFADNGSETGSSREKVHSLLERALANAKKRDEMTGTGMPWWEDMHTLEKLDKLQKEIHSLYWEAYHAFADDEEELRKFKEATSGYDCPESEDRIPHN